MVNHRILGITVTLVFLLAIPSSAYIFTFSDYSSTGWAFESLAVCSVDQYPTQHEYVGIYCHGASTYNSYWTTNFSSNYWAFSTVYESGGGSSHNIFPNFYSSTGAIIYSGVPTVAGLGRWEFIRTGTAMKAYYNGIFQYNLAGASATAPTMMGINTQTAGGGYILVDDVVIGDAESRKLSTLLPFGWSVRGDLLNPALNGTYDQTGTIYDTNKIRGYFSRDTNASGMAYLKYLSTGTIFEALPFVEGTSARRIEFNVTSLTLANAPYGLYYMDYSGAEYKEPVWYTAGGATIQFDAASYTQGDTATITTTFTPAYYLPDDYIYTGEILDLTGALMTSWPITSSVSSESVTLADYTNGDYYAALKAVKKLDSKVFYLAFDIASIENIVRINGYTKNAIDNILISTTNVNTTQLSTWYNTTSSAGSFYLLSGYSSGAAITINGSKPGYAYTPWDFTPLISGNYTIDILLKPMVVPNNTAIGGNAITQHEHDAVPGATVNIWNTTWANTFTANASGWYMFDGLAGGTSYNVNATHGSSFSPNYAVTAGAGLLTTKDLPIPETFILTVLFKDTNGAFITATPVTVSSSSGETNTTSTGSAMLFLTYGAFTITGSASGYYQASTNIVMTADRTITLTFSKSSTTSNVVYYIPHSVKFTVLTVWGAPIEDANITAQGFETTLGSWDWLKTLLGLPLDEAPIQNATMAGTTDTTGSANFMMIESVKYHITVYKAGIINKSMSIYPKDDYYMIVADGTGQFFTNGCNPAENFNYTVQPVKIAAGHYSVILNITDAMNQTTSGKELINRTNSTGMNENIISLTGLTGENINQTFQIYQTSGVNSSIVLSINLTHTSCGMVRRDFGISFPGEIAGPAFISHDIMFWFAAFCIIFAGCIFGATSAEQGALVVVIIAWLFTGISYRFYGIPLYYPNAFVEGGMLLLATVVAILANIMTRSKKERYI